MKNVTQSAPFIFFALMISGCVNTAKINQDIARVESGLNDVRGFQAEQTTKITSLETELHALQGRIDELEYSQNQKVGSALTNLKSDLSSLKRRVPPPPIVPVDALEDDEKLVGELPSEIATPFADALQHIREGDFQRALSSLDDATSLSLNTEWAPLMLFWTAVSYDGINDPKRALESYHELVTRFKKYKRVPLALLRQASVFVRLGDSKTARLTLNKLIVEYPKAGEAARAKERLKDIS